MGLLLSNQSYVTVADFKLMPLDYDLSDYTDAQIQDILVRASGAANSIMRRSQLAEERIDTFYGDGSNIMPIGRRPLLYVRQMQFVQPGIVGFVVPPNRVLVDYTKAQIVQYSPLELQGVGFVSVFPDGLPIAITYGWGYGYNPATAPSWTGSDTLAPLNGLAPGSYVVGITTRTQWGDTMPSYQTVVSANGGILAVINPVLGAWKYRVFITQGTLFSLSQSINAGDSSIYITGSTMPTTGQTLILDASANGLAEAVVVTSAAGGVVNLQSPTQYDHGINAVIAPQCNFAQEIPSTTFGGEATQGTVSSLVPPSGYYPETAPLTDTSAVPLPQEIREAVRLLALGQMYEQNNLANRGIASTDSGRKSIKWRPTTGTGGRGTPTLWQQAEEILKPQKLATIF
jgi:hypothetical protein